MTSEIYWIQTEKLYSHRIGTMARPRGNDWLDDEIRGLKHRGVDTLVSLLEQSEVWELGLQDAEKICTEWGVEFMHFPIEDVSVPEREGAFIQLAKELASQLAEGKSIVVHCRMGIGRSSIMAAAILIVSGVPADGIFTLISKYRRIEVPDTEEQKEWLMSIADQLGV